MNDKIASLSVNSYGGRQKHTFDYAIISGQKLAIGSVVRVDLRGKDSLGIVQKVLPARLSKAKQILPIKAVLAIRPLPIELLKLAQWLSHYYCASDKAIWGTILPSGLLAKSRSSLVQIPPADISPISPQLTAAQEKIYQNISKSKEHFFLLHGITGSGKTEIYLKLIASTIKQGRSALLLVPEIVLTPQTIARVEHVFGQAVLCYHSKLTAAKRKAIWLHVLESPDPVIIVGTRSSLFLPYQKLGLIVVDEEHEPSYKQDKSPRYLTRDVAAKMAHLHHAKLILGSATPSVSTYYLAKLGRLKLLNLNQRFGAAKLPQIQTIDLSNRPALLSIELSQAIKQTIAQGKQAILFINRRGSATALLCTSCGHAIKCPNCETSLTFHSDLARLLCHYCGYKIVPPALCPNCSSDALTFIGHGTKKLEAELTTNFNSLRVARIDSDNSDYQHINQTLEDFAKGKIDILVGTQMVSRGLDFLRVGLVGVVLADSVLNIADFSSTERTFELITQVIGRGGRNKEPAIAIIQSFALDNYAISAAATHDYQKFYRHEIATRKKYLYPPFCYLLKLSYAHKNQKKCHQIAEFEVARIRKIYPHTQVLGPVEAYIKRQAGKYRYNIIVKAKIRRYLTQIASELDDNWTIDLDPIQLL